MVTARYRGVSVSEAPPPGTADVTEWLWQNRTTRTHAYLGIAGISLGLLGTSAVVLTTVLSGLFIASEIVRGWIATFDFVNGLFIIMWSSTLIGLSANDGSSYQLRLRGRVRKGKVADIVAFIGLPMLAVIWGVFALHPVLAGRAADPAYLRRGATVSDLQQGVITVMVAYWVVVGMVYVLYVIGLRFNPVDLDAYDRIQRRVLRFGKSSQRS